MKPDNTKREINTFLDRKKQGRNSLRVSFKGARTGKAVHLDLEQLEEERRQPHGGDAGGSHDDVAIGQRDAQQTPRRVQRLGARQARQTQRQCVQVGAEHQVDDQPDQVALAGGGERAANQVQRTGAHDGRHALLNRRQLHQTPLGEEQVPALGQAHRAAQEDAEHVRLVQANCVTAKP